MMIENIIIIIVGFLIGWISTKGEKTQFIRIIDVLLYGPFIIYIGYSQ